MNQIIVINTNDYWQPNARASVETAAKRWGVLLLEVNSLLGADHPFATKFRLGQFVDPCERALYLDADMVIRSDCPSPFDHVPEDKMGAVLNFQGDTHPPEVGGHEAHQAESWDVACAQLGIDPRAFPYDVEHYINGGFILFSACHAPVLRVLEESITDPSGVYEQAAWGVVMKKEGLLHALPRDFNRIGPAVWAPGSPGSQMSAYVHHFANYFDSRGREEKAARIEALNWRVT